MIKLFLFGPFIFIDRFPFGFERFTLFNLRSENYYLKFKQRIILFILSFMAWYFFINYTFEQSLKAKQKEIDKIDISDWKKKYGYE